jgi:hypothetical protein
VRRLAALIAFAPVLGVAACGGTTPPDAGPAAPPALPSPPLEAAAVRLAPCTDGPEPAGGVADESSAEAFQEHAAAVAAAVEQYGQEHRDSFAGLWIDWTFHGITAAFTGSVEEHEAALGQFATAEVPVRAVKTRHTLAELERVQRQLANPELGIMPFASAIDVVQNRIELTLGVLDDKTRAALGKQFSGDVLCVDGPAPDQLVPEGPQPQSGPGWRLLADEPGLGTVWDTTAAFDGEGYRDLWQLLRLKGEPPAVDFEREIVLHFGPAVSSSCSNIRLDGLLIENDLVLPNIVQPGVQPPACTSDATPHTYLVAVERSALPATPFRVQLGRDVPPGVPESVTTVESLRAG